jgi:hypothetical protein
MGTEIEGYHQSPLHYKEGQPLSYWGHMWYFGLPRRCPVTNNIIWPFTKAYHREYYGVGKGWSIKLGEEWLSKAGYTYKKLAGYDRDGGRQWEEFRL